MHKKCNVGIIGVGNIGSNIAIRLMNTDVNLHLYDRYRNLDRETLFDNCSKYHDLSTLARTIDCVLCCLPDDKTIYDIIAGDSGIGNICRPGSTIIDLTTNRPTTSVELSNYCQCHGILYIDAPISGGVWRAKNGTLTMMIGGRNDELAEFEYVLNRIASNIVYFNDRGNGSKAKLLHNMIGEIQVHAIAESFCLAEHVGLNIDDFYKAISTGMASSQILTHLYKNGILSGNGQVNVRLETALKDQLYLNDMALEFGVSLEFTPKIIRIINKMIKEGYGQFDVTTTLNYYKNKISHA
jgi:3-hydroxyisobutyrate dehydrogenase-like beta-hydroxyacid dehydrogenase